MERGKTVGDRIAELRLENKRIRDQLAAAVALLIEGEQIKIERCYEHESWQWAMNEMSEAVNDAFGESQTCFRKALALLESDAPN